ncbi:MAG: prepilin-type N-terminal cleavage/methylation domain-containing protein, partial [Phycisphaerales bacterium]|nr:prepilin-type N-terminal cleavage/methylation domain-containing protein [Phycisphaerales bacterium]
MVLRDRGGVFEVRNTRRSGFTLVELLIVVMVLGILAAVVIPQFSDASEDAKIAALATDLQTVRMAIGRYTVEHDGRTPNLDPDGLERNTSVGFVNRLTQRTNKD